MLTKRQQGNKYELEVEKYLTEKEGYVCHRARQSLIRTKKGFFTRSNDIFECFDIIAKKKNAPFRLIQVSTGCRKAEKEKKILQYDIWDKCDVEIWLRWKGGIWKIYKLKNNEFVESKRIERGKVFEIRD